MVEKRYSSGKSGGSFSKGRGNSGSKNRKKKFDDRENISVAMLTKSAVAPEERPVIETRTFEETGLHHRLLRNLQKQNIHQMTEIQENTWDPVLAGENVIGLARTGSGKTIAFLLPLLQRKITNEPQIRVLIISPTRELANQIGTNAATLINGTSIKTACFTGGTDIMNDLRHLNRKPEILIGTPGRLMDLLERGYLDLRGFNTLILDEFDRMLDMGFVEDVHLISDAMPERAQTLLFSATVQGKIEPEIRRIQPGDAVRVQVNSGSSPSDQVEQAVVFVDENIGRHGTLIRLLKEQAGDKVLLFSETKRGVSRITQRLKEAGIRADEIHGDKSQAYRNRALESFRKGKIRVLVATDVAARGLDIPLVTDVINFEIPRTYDSYIHRIGRTGRAGNSGRAFTITDKPRERPQATNRKDRPTKSELIAELMSEPLPPRKKKKKAPFSGKDPVGVA